MLSESDLIQRCLTIEGLTFQQLASLWAVEIPEDPRKRKGLIGLLIEQALGTTAGTKALPDFHLLGIELKTIPINHLGRPAESTFITSIALQTIHQENWSTSTCYQKLKRILWVPIEDAKTIPFSLRRIGKAFLWSPSKEEERVLANDWQELTTMMTTGRLEEIHAGMGEYLQVRPKGQNALSLCHGFDHEGNKILTLPRGFYLRSRFTARLVGEGS